MARIEIPISTGFYASRSFPAANLECKNWYTQNTNVSGLNIVSIYGTAGINGLATTGEIQQVNRGAVEKSGIPYFVNGTSLYRLNRSLATGSEVFTVDSLGTIPGTGRVSIAENGTQVMILVPGGEGYIYNEDAITPFQQITDPDFKANGDPQHVVFIDGYFVVTTNSHKFINSALNDGLSWNALDFGSAEADPDSIVAPVVYGNQLIICGSKTIEGFQNVGGSGFPFSRIQGAVITTGVFAPFSLINTGDVQSDGTFMFIGGGVNESPSIQMFTGTSAVSVSTDAIDDILSRMSKEDIEAAFAVYYAESGSKFAIFIIKDRTFVYNITAGNWHELGSRVDINGQSIDTRWRVNSLITAYNRVLVGDSQDGRIGELSLNIYAEYDREILRTISCVPISNMGNSFTVPYVELIIETGTADAETPDPKIWMDRSLDGKTFKWPRTRSMGKIGEYMHRCIWRRNGRVQRFEIFRFTVSAKVKCVIVKLLADVL